MVEPKLDDYYDDEYRELLGLLREARVNVGLTQDDVARRLGKSQSFVSRSESGDRRLDVIELQALLRIYGLDLISFLPRSHELDNERRNK